MKAKINAVSILLTVLLFTACDDDFLNIEPPSSLTETSFFRNQADAASAITAAYNPLRNNGLYSNDYPKVTDGPSDDVIIHNTQGLSLDSWSFSSSDAIIDNVWQTAYEGIFRANLVLQKVPDIDMDKAIKNRILGEAYFLRALYYWHLNALFGEVPLVTEADPSDVSKAVVPKSPISDIQNLMISDLEQAFDLLPRQSAYSDEGIGRATQGAAEALLGKVHLYAENYPEAELHLGNVIASQEYALLDDFSNLLIIDNNPESIFEVQNADLINQGSNRLWFNYPQGEGGFANLLPTQDLVDAFENHAGLTAINGKDPRLFYSIFRNGDPYDEVSPVYTEAWTPTGYTMKKGLFPVIRFNNSNSPRNVPIIRLADVILMYAEAANENAKPELAVNAINEIRNRVGMPTLPTAEYPVGNKQEIFDAIVHERRVELAFEYHRLNDLRRWGLGEQVLGSLGYISPRHQYFPIPQQEISANPKLVQNPNY